MARLQHQAPDPVLLVFDQHRIGVIGTFSDVFPEAEEIDLRGILETLARLEQTDGLQFSDLISEAAVRIPRDATVVAVLSRVTPEMALALGELVRRGFLVTAIVVIFSADVLPDWAKPPEWAEILLAQSINFHMVNSEDAVTNLCAQSIVR